MNKERCNQIIDKVYGKYADSHEYFVDGWVHVIPMEYSKEMFVNECKKNPEFSEKWGLKIEERNLSYTEREELFHQNRIVILTKGEKIDEEDFDNVEIPTKLITLEYKGIKTETYE